MEKRLTDSESPELGLSDAYKIIPFGQPSFSVTFAIGTVLVITGKLT